MLTIRLTRKGKKNQPFFRIVVTDKRRSSKGGRAVEELGYVNPLTKKNSINKERALYWISKGAQPTPRIHNLLVSEKLIDAKKIKVFGAKKVKGGATAVASAPAGASVLAEASANKSAPEISAPAEEAKALEVAPAQPVAEPEKPVEAPKEEPKAPETPVEPAK